MRRQGLREPKRPDSSGPVPQPITKRRLAASHRTIRRAAIAVIVVVVAIIAAIACSETRHYRALSFFFDGVPKPGEKKQTGYTADHSADMKSVQPDHKAVSVKRYPHPPFRDGKCGSCHDNTTGQLVAKPEEGLCLRCHRKLISDLTYVHGPVAVNACLFCHHFHGSTYPKVLLADPTTLCLRCHTQADIDAGAHHKGIAETACTDCHDPHGGANRFFLRRNNEN